MTNITHNYTNYTGASMIELLAKFGEDSNGFYSNWWKNEDFAKEHPPKGTYEINFERKLTNLTFEEQKEKIPEGYSFTHPAIILEAIFEHYKNTGERLLEDWYSRTDSRSSSGGLVYVGSFDSDGVGVSDCRPDSSNGRLGVSFSRRLGDLKIDNLELSDRVSALEKDMASIKKFLII